jgi:hypothetical protein
MRSPFAQVFERHVAAKAESDQSYLRVGKRRMFDHCPEIASIPAVIKPQESIWFSSTSSEIPGKHIPTRRDERHRHASDASILRTPFQTM